MFEPTLYSVTQLRARNQATNTISNALRAIQCFYMFLVIREIDLKSRLNSGELLLLSEIDDLVRFCRLPLKTIERIRVSKQSPDLIPKIVSLEKRRSRLSQERIDDIDPVVAGNRVRCIRDYLLWYVKNHTNGYSRNNSKSRELDRSLDWLVSALSARIPKGRATQKHHQREGLEQDSIDTLFKVIEPNFLNNPWKNEYVRHRNALIVQWLYYLGIRRGELLGVRVEDINYRSGTVEILRRADDNNDPRVNQPQTKTRSREIALSESLQRMTYDFVMKYRSSSKGAQKHGFLFCANLTGRPLSLPGLNKIFQVLKDRCPNIPSSLSPHVLRHTWNDQFSEEMDKQNIGEETEKKIRSYIMGWSETSNTAATYTRRHNRKKAQEVSLKMQRTLMDGKINE